ncbi:hypothetical protein BKA70DRAFT_1298417 [Coprinopsis sp. MPI-PUGE-AT-0042]|nr:hypothetical protein BKA70DRAFT_1298417 [Coprinopsis sp. MPI-PUGE-AT-0042]
MADKFSEDDWNYAGSLLAASYFAGPMLATALLAIQVFMVFFQTSVFLDTPKQERRGRLFFVLVSWVLLIAASINFALSAMSSYFNLFLGGPTGISYALPQSDSVPRSGSYTRAAIAGDAFLCIAVAVGDILMLWRCFELWRHKKWIVVPPLLACVGTIVSLSISLAPWGYENAAFSRIKAIIASVALSVTMNIMVTGLILFRLLMAWLTSRKVLAGQNTYMYSSVTAIIIESAAPLAISGICFITTTVIWLYYPPTDLRRQARLVFLRDMFNWVYYSFCTLAPQMIMFRVTIGKSWRNAKERVERGEFSQSIRFVGGKTETRGFGTSSNDDI